MIFVFYDGSRRCMWECRMDNGDMGVLWDVGGELMVGVFCSNALLLCFHS